MQHVRRIDHINIRTRLMDESAAFYERLLGLKATVPPGMGDIQAIWLRDDRDYPIVHLNAPPVNEPDRSDERDTGRLHHIAFDCQGHDAIVATLDDMGAPYECNLVASIGLRQIFVLDPNAVRLELNFTGD